MTNLNNDEALERLYRDVKAMKKDHGLLFKPDMIRAFLEHRKTQTRRILTRMNVTLDGPTRCSKDYWQGFDFNDAYLDDGPSPAGNPGPYLKVFNTISQARHRLYPIYQVGDRVWAKTTFRITDMGMVKTERYYVSVEYKDNDTGLMHYFDYCLPDNVIISEKWISPIFMPKWASCIWRKITEVRIQRVQEILPIDIVAEGVYVPGKYNWTKCESIAAFLAWEKKWNEIYSERGYPWENNDWVIALTLE